MLEMSLSGLMSGDEKRDNGFTACTRARPRLYNYLVYRSSAFVSFAYSDLATMRMGTSGSAPSHDPKKS
jgi:hypothetical protein